MRNMMEGPVDVIGLSLTLDANDGISSSEARIILEKAIEETAVEIGLFSISGNRVTLRIFGDFIKRGNFLDIIAKNRFVIQKSTSLAKK